MIHVTCAMLICNGKVLITQNNELSDHPFQWEFPGGKIKLGETEEACIIREIKEELELDIEVIEAMIPLEHDYELKKIKLIPFVCSIKGGSLKLNNHISKKWVKIPELKGINFSDADKRLISFTENFALLEKYSRK